MGYHGVARAEKCSIHVPLFGEDSCNDPLTILDGLAGFGGNPAVNGGESGSSMDGVFWAESFSEVIPRPRPFFEIGLAGEEASKPADFMAASSSFLVGSLIGERLRGTSTD